MEHRLELNTTVGHEITRSHTSIEHVNKTKFLEIDFFISDKLSDIYIENCCVTYALLLILFAGWCWDNETVKTRGILLEKFVSRNFQFLQWSMGLI